MDILTDHMLQIDYELIRRDSGIHQSLPLSNVYKPPFLDRALTSLGETFIQFGNRLKQHSYHTVTVEKASEPTFMIML